MDKDKILIISDFSDIQYKKDSGTPALRLIVEALAERWNVHMIQPHSGHLDQMQRGITYHDLITRRCFRSQKKSTGNGKV